MYYKIAIYLYFFTMLLSLFLFFRYINVKKNQLDLKTKSIYRDDIKTGDVFLIDWQRANNIFLASLFGNSFMHPSIAVWDKGDLFMIELINYFNDEKYKGFIKIPFNKWYRINKRGLFLHNVLNIKDDEDGKKREELGKKILDFYIEYKGKMGEPSGFGRDWIRFWYPSEGYKPIEKFDSIICTEVMTMLLKETGIVKKNKSIESYVPDSFIGMRDFECLEPYDYKEHYLANINEN
jgi:hypothetical protein